MFLYHNNAVYNVNESCRLTRFPLAYELTSTVVLIRETFGLTSALHIKVVSMSGGG